MTAPPEEGPFAAPPLVYVVQPAGAEYRILREEDLEERQLPQPDEGDTRPIAYMYHPVGYQIVPPEGLEEWEKAMTDRVGLRPRLTGDSGAHAEMRKLPSVSFCCDGGGISMSCSCDSDEV